jgi:RNA polymerase sigma-70 factor (ECF subfamily)
VSEASQLGRALANEEAAFAQITESLRRELQLHCYRIVGSVQDSEDLVQETLLAAWRGLQHFEGRASVRSWLYRIATNHCLNHLRDRGRHVANSPPPTDVHPTPPPPTRLRDPLWLEPYPDSLLVRRAYGRASDRPVRVYVP